MRSLVSERGLLPQCPIAFASAEQYARPRFIQTQPFGNWIHTSGSSPCLL